MTETSSMVRGSTFSKELMNPETAVLERAWRSRCHPEGAEDEVTFVRRFRAASR